MGHIAAILAAERALVRRGVSPASAADAARSAWLAAWERGGDSAPGTRGAPLYRAARRLSTPGRNGAARSCAPILGEDLDRDGGDPSPALDDLLDAAAEAGRSLRSMVAAARRAHASLADIGAACGVTGETVRAWGAGRTEPRLRALEDLRAFLARLGT